MSLPGEDLGDVVPLYAREGPFVTAYLDVATRPDQASVVERWAAVRSGIEADDVEVDEDSLDAIEDAVECGNDCYSQGAVLVAAEGSLLFHRVLPVRPEGDSVRVGELPHLLPYVTTRLTVVPNLVLAIDPGRSRILRIAEGGIELLWPAGPAEPNDDESVARAFSRNASAHNPDVVILTGRPEVSRRALVGTGRVLTADVSVRIVDLDVDDLTALSGTAEEIIRARRRPQLDEVRERLTRKRVATGARDVADALRMAQAEAVVLGRGATLPEQCWVGRRPTEFGLHAAEAAHVGVEEIRHDRFDAALVRAVAATRTRMIVLDRDDPPLPGGIAAILRD